jgi:hypothetical protein
MTKTDEASAPWRTIETAPIDGTVILITENGWVDRGWWSKSIWLGTDGPGWVSEDERENGIVHNPTHWMPLPPPPQEPRT